jgi:hypothetical protein
MDAKPPILPRIEIIEEPDLLNPPPAGEKADE